MAHTRRDFLVGAGCGLLSGHAFLTGFQKLSLMNIFANEGARAQGSVDYRALVCIFMYGGNDSNNMLIPKDNYAAYDAVRGGAGVQFRILQTDLLDLPSKTQGAVFGLPNRTTYDTTGLKSMYDDGKLAFVSGVGTLYRPFADQADYLANPTSRPDQLFSHSNQQGENESSISHGSFQTGWGGRLADRVHTSESFPISTSVNGVHTFIQGSQYRPLVVPSSGSLAQALPFVLPGGRQAQLSSAVDNILVADSTDTSPTMRKAVATVTQQSLGIRDSLQTDPPIATTFPNTSLGNQLKQIAKFIKIQSTLGMRRQIFMANLGGWDTHTNQNNGQGGLLTQVSNAMKAFYDEMTVQGMLNNVTTFTQSDFTRTFKPGGGQTGTDHAWSASYMVMGGAVRGGDIYGVYPDLTLGGPSDTETNPASARGRWIPTTSIEQYAAQLARWLGASAGDINLIFPRIGDGTFDPSPAKLQFMNPVV